MNRLYLMPKIFIVAFIIIYFNKPKNLIDILLVLLIATLIVFIIQILYILFKGKYYLFCIKIGKIINKEKIYVYINQVLKTVNYFLRLKIKVHNFERFNPKRHYLITPNHQSNTDVPILLEIFKTPIVFVAKIAISKVILVKDWMKLIGSLYLDKNDMRSQIKIMKEVEGKINNKESVIIFPEGKRSFTSNMNAFKPGTFKLAIKTKVDILPVTINNAYKLKNNYPWKKTDISVYFHEPIPYEVYKDMSTQEIAKMVQNIVESKIIYE